MGGPIAYHVHFRWDCFPSHGTKSVKRSIECHSLQGEAHGNALVPYCFYMWSFLSPTPRPRPRLRPRSCSNAKATTMYKRVSSHPEHSSVSPVDVTKASQNQPSTSRSLLYPYTVNVLILPLFKLCSPICKPLVPTASYERGGGLPRAPRDFGERGSFHLKTSGAFSLYLPRHMFQQTLLHPISAS